MGIIGITADNIDAEHICCALGNDKKNKRMAATKKEWLKARFPEGLRFKRLDDRGKVFIEYLPVEYAWKPLDGANWMAIDCLWVSGRYKGQGHSSKLLAACVADAKREKMDGVVAVSSAKVKPFLTDKKFWESQGFVPVDTAPPYFELMALKFHPDSPVPAFNAHAKSGTCPEKGGLVFVYSNQCPFMEDYVAIFADVAKRKGLRATLVKLESAAQARAWGSPFGTLGIYRDGRFVTHELMPEARMEKLLDGLRTTV